MKNIIYSILILTVFTSFQIIYGNQQTTLGQANNIAIVNKKIENKVILYFPEIEELKLVKEERVIKNIQGNKAEIIMNELIKGPKEDNLMSIIPKGTELNSAQIKNNIAYIDLSQEFISNHPGGSWGEHSTIYGIVNSLCELEEVEAVQILIDGDIKDEFKGHININKPLEMSQES